MKVVTFETTDGKVRYLLADAGGIPIEEGKGFDTGWGRLKSGAGWISLDFTSRV